MNLAHAIASGVTDMATLNLISIFAFTATFVIVMATVVHMAAGG